MDIKRYIIESEKKYKLRLKSVVPLDDTAMDSIEFAVAKYQPLELSNPKKTIIQSHPVDFVNVTAAEVYIVDMTFGLPVNAMVLRDDIRKALKAPETFVVVRYPNDAIEIEGERKHASWELENERKKKGMRYGAILDTDKDYPEANDFDSNELAGNEYNSAFLSYLATVRKEREDAKVKVENLPFSWMDIPDRRDQEPFQSDEDFNASIKDAPKINPNVKVPKSIEDRNILGNIDDRTKITKLYKDKDGNRVVASFMMGKDQ